MTTENANHNKSDTGIIDCTFLWCTVTDINKIFEIFSAYERISSCCLIPEFPWEYVICHKKNIYIYIDIFTDVSGYPVNWTAKAFDVGIILQYCRHTMLCIFSQQWLLHSG